MHLHEADKPIFTVINEDAHCEILRPAMPALASR